MSSPGNNNAFISIVDKPQLLQIQANNKLACRTALYYGTQRTSYNSTKHSIIGLGDRLLQSARFTTMASIN